MIPRHPCETFRNSSARCPTDREIEFRLGDPQVVEGLVPFVLGPGQPGEGPQPRQARLDSLLGPNFRKPGHPLSRRDALFGRFKGG